MTEPVAAIKKMTMRRHPAWAHYHQNKRPKTYHEAQVSLPYSVAVALIEGAAMFPQYQNEKLGEPEILRLSDLLEIVPDDSLPRGVSCHLVAETAGGAKLESQIDHPKGSIANPMTDAEMRRKVHILADPLLGDAQVDKMIAAIDTVENAGLHRYADEADGSGREMSRIPYPDPDKLSPAKRAARFGPGAGAEQFAHVDACEGVPVAGLSRLCPGRDGGQRTGTRLARAGDHPHRASFAFSL